MSDDQGSAPKCNGVGQGGGKEDALASRSELMVPVAEIAALLRLLRAARAYLRQTALCDYDGRVATGSALVEAVKACEDIA